MKLNIYYPIQHSGSSEVRQECFLQDSEEQILSFYPVHPFQEQHNALFMSRYKTGGHIALSLLLTGAGAGYGEPQTENPLQVFQRD
jgi:hypothetical protein